MIRKNDRVHSPKHIKILTSAALLLLRSPQSPILLDYWYYLEVGVTHTIQFPLFYKCALGTFDAEPVLMSHLA